MIIDFHTHAFPDSLAEKAIPLLASKGNITAHGKGTVSDLVEKMDEQGVDVSVVLSIATKPEQETNVNNFAISLRTVDRIYPLGSVYPGSDSSEQEIERLFGNGIKGIKLHPEYQNFDVLDEKMFETYSLCGEKGMFVVLHTGADVAFDPPYHSDPFKLNKLCEMFPKTKFVLAHMGGYDMWRQAAEILKYHENMYVDTSMINTVSVIDNDSAKSIIDNVGYEHVLFGSDLPWGLASHSIEKLQSLNLSEYELDHIFYRNAVRLLDI